MYRCIALNKIKTNKFLWFVELFCQVFWQTEVTNCKLNALNSLNLNKPFLKDFILIDE